MEIRILALAVLLLACGAPAAPGSENAAESPAPGKVLEALSALESLPLEEVWGRLHELRAGLKSDAGGASPLEELERRLFTLPERTRLAGAALILLSRRERLLGQTALLELAREAASKEVRIAAIRLLGREGEVSKVYPVLLRIVEGSTDPDIRIPAVLALWELDNSLSVLLPLVQLLQSSELRVRAEAAMALAQTGYYDTQVIELLRQLRREPGERAARADLLYRLHAFQGHPAADGRRLEALERENARLRQQLAAASPAGSAGAGGDRTLEELVDILRRHHVEPDQVSAPALYLEAFKAMVSSLDHSSLLSADDLERLQSRSLGQHLGLGAQLVKPSIDAELVVARSFVAAPGRESSLAPDESAHSERLLAGDRILEIDGMPTRGQSADEIKNALSRKASGDPVYLKVKRLGSESPRMLRLRYGTVEVANLLVRLLPERIGYIKLQRFAPDTALELRQALLELGGEGGLGGLILDLRDNGGGLLDQAVRIVDLFVGREERPIVSEVRPGARSPPIDHAASADRLLSCPLVLLVNRWTASAAEVVAGSLQDFRRAIVVGERTYGKGVSQVRLDAPPSVRKLLGGPAAIQIPTHYLVLPLGRRFHGLRDRDGRPLPGREGGILPDIHAEQGVESFEGNELEEFRMLQHSPRLLRYIDEHFTAICHLWAEGDLWDPGKYTDFDALYASLETRLSPAEVRLALRLLIRRHFEDASGHNGPDDPLEDSQLRRGILALLERMGIEARSSAAYRRLAGQ
jgi:C-terminal peptidase prc